MAKRQTKKAEKKKRWFKIVAPKFLGETPIGESYLSEPETAIGKAVKVNLMHITRDIKTQNITVRFRIIDFKDNFLQTKIIGYSFLPASIKRLVRRRMTRVDDSIVIKTKDNQYIKIKPMLLTRGKVSKLIDSKFRTAMNKEIIDFVTKITYEELFSIIIKNRLQMELKNKFTKIYPVRSVLIRVLEETKKDTVGMGVDEPVIETIKEEKKEEKPTKTDQTKAEKPVKEASEKKEEDPAEKVKVDEPVKEKKLEKEEKVAEKKTKKEPAQKAPKAKKKSVKKKEEAKKEPVKKKE